MPAPAPARGGAPLVAEASGPAFSEHPAALVGWVSTAALALVLGKVHARAGRDWCRRHAIPLRRDGKFNFARLADVRRALDGLGPENDDAPAGDRGAAIRAGLATIGAR